MGVFHSSNFVYSASGKGWSVGNIGAANPIPPPLDVEWTWMGFSAVGCWEKKGRIRMKQGDGARFSQSNSSLDQSMLVTRTMVLIKAIRLRDEHFT